MEAYETLMALIYVCKSYSASEQWDSIGIGSCAIHRDSINRGPFVTYGVWISSFCFYYDGVRC